MANFSDENFIELINKTTGERIYLIKFDFGTRHIDVPKNKKVTLNYLHGGFEKIFTRKGNDLIIGDDWYHVMFQRLGVGFGKEVWYIQENDDSTYSVTISKYSWRGSYHGYSVFPSDEVTIEMTSEELANFQAKHNVTVTNGINTLYTTWPVLPNPIIYYHMNDCGDYAPANGKIILHNYFLNGENTVFVGDELLKDIIKECGEIYFIGDKESYKPLNLKDTFLSENIYGGTKSDKIRSLAGDDIITGGLGNDKITLGKGHKTIVVSQGDGRDVIYNSAKSDSVTLEFDGVSDVSYTKSGNNLIINREYSSGNGEETVIADYFKNFKSQPKLTITDGNDIITQDVNSDLKNGVALLKIQTVSRTVKGTDFNDDAYSSYKDETFALGKGNDIIHFRSDGMFSFSPYSFGKDTVKLVKGSHITLDFDDVGGRLSYERRGNDAVITARHQIELCGRSNGKEEWLIKKGVNDSYEITKSKYLFTGDRYRSYGVSTVITMSKSELNEFQSENNVSLKVGKNTLYTSRAVVPDSVIHYSKVDTANWGIALGSVTLKDYFKYGEDSVYIGNQSLMDIFRNSPTEYAVDKSHSKRSQTISDTFMDEILIGGKKSDKITSLSGDDTIIGGKGNDTITLGEGDKTVLIGKGDGKDSLIITSDNTSTNIVFDPVVKGISFIKSGLDIVINRDYNDKTERTVIKNFYLSNLRENNTKITVGGSVVFDSLGFDITHRTWTNEVLYSVDELQQNISAWQTTNEGYLPEYSMNNEVSEIQTMLVQGGFQE